MELDKKNLGPKLQVDPPEVPTEFTEQIAQEGWKIKKKSLAF
jgi:hypothetical protein